jgi:hypothetical protein
VNTCAGWTGWFRRHGRATWEQAVEASDVSTCVRKLLRFLREHKIRLRSNLDRIVTTGAYPDVAGRDENVNSLG